MKKLILFLTLSLSLLGSDIAKKLNYYTDYDKALKASIQADKPLMLVQVTEYCPWCRKLEESTLCGKDIKRIVSERFIPLLVFRDKSEFPKKFRTPRVPTIFFIKGKTEEGYWEGIGYMEKDELFNNLEIALKMYDE